MTNAGSYLEEVTQTRYKFVGGTYGMDILKNRIDDVTDQGKYAITGFEGTIDEASESGHRMDFKLLGPEGVKLVETKNYATPPSISGAIKAQFTKYMTSTDYFEYWVRTNPAGWKQSFENLFKNTDVATIQNWIDANPNFFGLLLDPNDIKTMATAGTLKSHAIMNFVKN